MENTKTLKNNVKSLLATSEAGSGRRQTLARELDELDELDTSVAARMGDLELAELASPRSVAPPKFNPYEAELTLAIARAVTEARKAVAERLS